MVNEMAKMGGDITPDYLNKLESGTRSLASASLEVREAMRTVLGVSRSEWEETTGLHTPLPTGNIFPVERTTRTAPLYRLTASDGKGELVNTNERFYIDEDLEGDYIAIVTQEDERHRTTLIVKQQDFAEPRDEIICELDDEGVVHAELFAQTEEMTVLTYGGVPHIPEHLKILGVVVSTRRDRIK